MKKVVSINDPLDYEKDILRVLDQLEASLELHNIFDTIVKPEDPSHPINDVVRCLFGLPPGTLITDVHARQAALTALLFPFETRTDRFLFRDLPGHRPAESEA